MTNTVTPSITVAATEVWFDPTGSTKIPVEVRFSIAQTDAAAAPYLAGGTIRRSRENVELYLDEGCTRPLSFSENQARLTNAELLADDGSGGPKGLVAWVLGTRSSLAEGVTTRLSLSLDLLETSERKQTSFGTGAKTNRINVDNTAPAGTKTLEIKAAAVVTPTLAIGSIDDPDPRVWPDGAATPLIASFVTQANESTSGYDGDGELVLEPADAKLGLFADELGTRPIPFVSGSAKIAGATLQAASRLWLRVTGDAAPTGVKLSLRLSAATKPKEIRTAGPVTQGVMLVRASAVSPKLAVSLPPALDGVLWFPPLAAVAVPAVALQITQTHADEVPYTGDALLVRSCGALRLFWDEALTRPVAFFEDRAVLPGALLTGSEPLRLHAAAVERADVVLTLSLYDPKRRALVVGGAVQQTIACKPVNVVLPRVEYDGSVGPGRLTKAKVFAAQSNAADAPYDKEGQLTRDDVGVVLYRGQADGRGIDPVFMGTDRTARVSNDDVRDPGKTWLASWTGQDPPSVEAKLALVLPPSSRAYVVTDPAAQLRPPAELVWPPVPLGGTNLVTPRIETEYDLVLLATSETGAATRTTPVRARLYVEQSNAGLPYQGDGMLVRSTPGLRVFLDEACTVELGWSDTNKAVIPNALLVDTTRVYWLRGVAAGKLELTLTAAPVADGVPRPAITVAKAASKSLAVVALVLRSYRDDAGLPTPASVPMTTRDQRTRGRFVPVQSAKKDLGRAKLVVEKVATGDWPDTADKHALRLAVTSAEDVVEVFDAETDGSVVASKTTAYVLPKDKAGAKDCVLWVQGKAASAELRDVRVDLGLERSDGAGWSDRKPLHNGDFVLLTSVRIVRVTPDADDWRQYVNQRPDRSLTVDDNQAEAATGRGILVTATVEPAKAGIGIDLVLWGLDGNGDAEVGKPRVPRIPVTLRASEEHATAVTSAAGRASARLGLSRFGGDEFYAVAYLADDAIKGLAELGKKGNDAPATTKSKKIQVWQKLAYTLAVMKRWNTGDYSARANEGTFRAKYAASFLELERVGDVKVVAHRNILDDSSAVGGWWTSNKLPDPEERTFNLVLCDSLADPPSDTTVTLAAFSGKTAVMTLKGAYKLDTQGDWLVSGSGAIVKVSDGSLVAAVPDNLVTLAYSGPADYKLRVRTAGLLPPGVSRSDVQVEVTLREQDTFSGFSSGPKTFVAMRLREQDASVTYDPTESANHTMWHEAGHYLGLTAKKVPDEAGTLNVFWYEGWPGITSYNEPSPPPPTKLVTRSVATQIGQGPHCHYSNPAFDEAELDTDGAIGPGQDPECIMFHALSTPITVDYCADCEKALRARDLSSPSVDGSADF